LEKGELMAYSAAARMARRMPVRWEDFMVFVSVVVVGDIIA
jgi:hypothetical protein